MIQVDDALTLNNTTISGGAINGAGTIDVTIASTIHGGATPSTSHVTADAKLTLDGMTVDGSTITDNSTVETDHTVKLKGGATIKGASAESQGLVTNNGTLVVLRIRRPPKSTVSPSSAPFRSIQVDDGLTLDDVTISGGAING